MIRPPSFASLKDDVERLDDGDLWSLYLVEIRARQGLPTAGEATLAGRAPHRIDSDLPRHLRLRQGAVPDCERKTLGLALIR